ncbi:MAG: DUF4386 domain-containing protein [Dokdonella sp.]|uniref:DUF4386 domain-containing protein n=1 Tax=Dokdonella sp. TaxID=2291710 RepID=UPI00326600EA
MNTITHHISPRMWARVGGLLYLAIIAIGLFGEASVRSGMVVSGDATATAHNLLADTMLWRVGVAAELVLLVCATGLALVEYVLLRPVDRRFALLALLLGMLSIAVEAMSALSLSATLVPLGSASYLKAFAPEQLNAMAYLSIKAFENGFGVSLIFFGFECLVTGYLIFRSGYLPPVIGVLMQIAGICYLANSFALILSPTLADWLFPAVLLPPLVAEGTFCLWLLIKGVDRVKWEAREREDADSA